MALTDSEVKNLRHNAKSYKRYDERGLFILVKPSGSKLWRFNYQFNKSEKTLALGAYPAVSLKAARIARDAEKALLRQGIGGSPISRSRH
jgi:hypothetical protein